MVKPLTFKGDKKSSKKRKRTTTADDPTQDDAPTSKALVTSTEQAEEDADDTSWVSADAPTDVSGPVIFVLPTDTPSCLSCDANGKVFKIDAENIVEADPTTAEPHDVRQVWIANRVAGSESFSFKGHHGKYLSNDKFGILSADKDAVSPSESFTLIPVADTPGAFAVQTVRDRFLSADNKEVRADSENIDFKSTLRIRMQAKFKPRLKAKKETKALEKISRKELEEKVGRRLDEGEVKMLKKARREGNFHEAVLDVKVKGKHDKFA